MHVWVGEFHSCFLKPYVAVNEKQAKKRAGGSRTESRGHKSKQALGLRLTEKLAKGSLAKRLLERA